MFFSDIQSKLDQKPNLTDEEKNNFKALSKTLLNDINFKLDTKQNLINDMVKKDLIFKDITDKVKKYEKENKK